MLKPPHCSRIHSVHNLAPSLQIILFIYPDVRLSSSVHELLNTRWAVDHGKTLVGLSSDKWIWQCPGRLILPVLAAWRCGLFWLAATANRLATARQNSEHFLMNWVIKKKKTKGRLRDRLYHPSQDPNETEKLRWLTILMRSQATARF